MKTKILIPRSMNFNRGGAEVTRLKARTPGLLILACLLAAAPATAQVNYASVGNTAFVSTSPDASGDIVIASTYSGYPVAHITSFAFSGCTNLTSVTIPDSVTSMGDSVFSGCTSLTSVTFLNSLTGIGPQAFFGCTSLTNVILGNSVTSIGPGAFSGCTSLTNVIIGNSVTNIGYIAFGGCTSLTRLTIPASVTNIGAYAFYSCTNLTNFTFLGNAPRLVFDIEAGGAHFLGVGAGAKAYYYCGTTGWGPIYGPTFSGLPTVMLCAPQIAPGSTGVRPGGFAFTLTRLTNQTIVVEASANLANWQPIWTNTLPGASADFVDLEWLQHPLRFYRARSD